MTDTTMTDTTTPTGWIGSTLVDREGQKVGKIEQVYLDDQSGQPEWVTVSTGLFGRANTFVPVQGARHDGDQVVAGWTKDVIKDAPRVEDDADGHLSPEEEDRLYTHYGVGSGTAAAGAPVEQAAGTPVGHDTSGPTTDDAMTRSEEELRVGVERREAGRARLRKYVVTEQVQTTVPVRHEEVRVEREPITDANRGAAMDGPAISEEEHEVVLHEERPVVAKEAVPKERVRLATEEVAGEEQVSDEVRKERIEPEGGIREG